MKRECLLPLCFLHRYSAICAESRWQIVDNIPPNAELAYLGRAVTGTRRAGARRPVRWSGTVAARCGFERGETEMDLTIPDGYVGKRGSNPGLLDYSFDDFTSFH